MPFVKFLFNREPSTLRFSYAVSYDRARGSPARTISERSSASSSRFVPMTRRWQDIAVHQVV